MHRCDRRGSRDTACQSRVIDALGCPVRVRLHGASPGWQDYESALAAAGDRFEPPLLAPDHMCFLPYTSGSTGRPKGVVLTHAGQCWWLRCIFKYWPSSPDTRTLVAVPLYHKNAMAGAIKPTLAIGGSTVILPNFEPRRFLHALVGLQMHQGRRRAGGLHAAAAGTRPDREPRLLEPRDADGRLGADAEGIAGRDRGCVQGAGGRDVRSDGRRTGDGRIAARRTAHPAWIRRRRLAGGRGEAGRADRTRKTRAMASSGSAIRA